MVEGDVDAVRRVIANLLSNADKYSPIERPIALTLGREVDSTGAGWARVVVTDQGPGIPEGERERLWEQFHQISGIKAHDAARGARAGTRDLLRHH